MKKVFSVFLCLFICWSLTACDLSFNKDGGEIVANLTQLPSPTLTEIVDDYIYWEEVPNASSYVVKINNYQENAGNQLKYSISSIMDGRVEYDVPTELHIYVKAKGNQILYSDSEWSTEKTYTYTKKSNGNSGNPSGKIALVTPVFSYDERNNVIEWDSVTGADGYEIRIDDSSIILPQMTKCEYRPSVESGVDFTFSMRALAPENSVNSADSNWTRSIALVFKPLKEEKITDLAAVTKAKELGIGYAYNFVENECINVLKSSPNSVIDLNSLFQNSSLNVQSSSYADSGSIYKETISDFQTSFAVSMNSEVSAGGAFDIFSANVAAGLESSTSIDFSKYGKSGFLNCYSYAEYKNYQVIDFGDFANLSNIFTDSFKDIINKEGAYASLSDEKIAEYIFNNYGTHLILGVKTGGRLDYFYSFATNNSKVAADFKTQVYANASTEIGGIITASTNNSLSTELSLSLSKGDTEKDSSFRVYGGSTDGISASNISEKITSWSSSINDENARSIGVSRNGIVYLPTLISYVNPNLGNILDALIKEKADASYQKLMSQFKTADTFIDTGKLDDLVVYNSTIRKGEYKVTGSGRTCSASFALSKSISNLKSMGYNKVRVYIDYQLREQDNCWIYVNLYDENNKSLYYRRVEHGGTAVNYDYASYTIELELDLDKLPSNKFRIEFKAEDKIFKDFYVGTVTGKATAILV